MLDKYHYVPILKGKEAEYGALKELKGSPKEKMTPLWEIPPIPFDYQNGCPAKTIDEHLSNIESRILGAWVFKRPAYIDLSNIYEGERMQDGTHPIEYVLREGRAKQLKLIPVSGFNRDDAYQKAIHMAHRTDKLGVCLRIGTEDFEDLAGGSSEKETQIKELLKSWQIKPEETDLILDFGAITENQASSTTITAIALISSLPYVDKWRTIIFAGTAFPKDLRDVRPNGTARLPRTEWQVWKSLMERGNRLVRTPVFGDYGINHPVHSEVDPRIIKMSAGLRYTTDNDWLIFKGRNVQKHGSEQFNRLCADLIQMKDYKGKDFSWGDGEIYTLAKNHANSGNATTWRKIGFNHHFAMVINQLASLSGS